ncbi:MAG: sugar ABC transporter permease [Microthrixaceae bacterium]|jgi:sn-glycerol 3-phosphate transport system permease protein|nr:sugar ABC transporter permease [Actinomycetota bacterium]
MATRPSPGRASGRRARDSLLAASFLAPAFAVFAVFAYYPLYRLVYLSLYRPNRNTFIGGSDEWIGGSNIIDSLTSSTFLRSLAVTAKFAVLTVPMGIILGVLLAVAADRKLRGIRIFQTIFSSTVASSVAVASVVFFTLLQPEAGLWRNVSWLSIKQPGSALVAISTTAVWQNAGLTFVIVLAALQALPSEVREAAELDGYGPVRRFFRITVPLISPALLFLAVVLVIHALQAYAQFEILKPTNDAQPLLYKIADPEGVETISSRAVYSLGLFVVSLIVSIAQFGLLERRVHYGE